MLPSVVPAERKTTISSLASADILYAADGSHKDLRLTLRSLPRRGSVIVTKCAGTGMLCKECQIRLIEDPCDSKAVQKLQIYLEKMRTLQRSGLILPTDQPYCYLSAQVTASPT